MTADTTCWSRSSRVHSWLRRVRIAWVPGSREPLIQRVVEGMLACFRHRGDEIQAEPGDDTDVLLTSASSDEPLSWRQALLFNARRRFGLRRMPTVFTMVGMQPERFSGLLERFRRALSKEPPDPADWQFPGLAPRAARVLIEQSRRGGPILALERLLQARTKSFRVILIVGEDQPLCAYHFDLAGAHPRTMPHDPEAFYQDLVLRIATAVSTRQVNEHQMVDDPVPWDTWQALSTPAAMHHASRQLGERGFFTEMVRIADLVEVPAVAEGVASQYSEGCFATWEPELGALLATVTGSARPVDKGSLSDDDLALIVGLRADGAGALVRPVAGKANLPPSSEAVEMMLMDHDLPRVTAAGVAGILPVIRSKLHGHRGIGAYDPRRVEFVPLDPPYLHYPVSCATEAQAQAIRAAFARSEALRNPNDPRQIVFTLLPGHGVVIVEKWVAGKAPFQIIWEGMDSGAIEVQSTVPQGPFTFIPSTMEAGRLVMECEEDIL